MKCNCALISLCRTFSLNKLHKKVDSKYLNSSVLIPFEVFKIFKILQRSKDGINWPKKWQTTHSEWDIGAANLERKHHSTTFTLLTRGAKSYTRQAEASPPALAAGCQGGTTPYPNNRSTCKHHSCFSGTYGLTCTINEIICVFSALSKYHLVPQMGVEA